MDNLNDIQELWRKMDTRILPDATKASHEMKKFRRLQQMKSAFMLFFLLAITAVLLWLIFFSNYASLTTRLGEACYVFALIILFLTNIKALKRTSRSNTSNSEFLEYLKEERREQINFFEKTQAAGYALAAAGLLLYSYEGLRQQTGWLITGYTALIIVLSAGWFFVRPRVMKKKLGTLNDAIHRAQQLSEQLNKQ